MSKRLASAVQHYNAMTRNLHPDVDVIEENKPTLLDALIYEFTCGQAYDSDVLGAFLLLGDKRVAFTTYFRHFPGFADWDSPEEFDRHFVKTLNKAAKKYEHLLDLGIAYRLHSLPEDAEYQLLCHPDCADDALTYWTNGSSFLSRKIKRDLHVITTKAIPKTYHFLTPRQEFLGLAVCSKDYSQIGWFFVPMFVIRINHTSEVNTWGDVPTSEFDKAKNNLCKYGNRYVKQTSDANRPSYRRRSRRTIRV